MNAANSAIVALASLFIAIPAVQAAPISLEPSAPVALTAPAGGFDYMAGDTKYNRVFATHPGANGVSVLTTKDNKGADIDVGCEVNGVAIDPKGKKVFFAGGGKKLMVFEQTSMKKIGEVALDGPADGIDFDTKNNKLYIDEDEGKQIWVVDTAALKVIQSIAIEGVPEFIEYDANTDRIYQNIKSTNDVQVIDPNLGTVVATWPTSPVTSPHGLAIDKAHERLFIGGRNGKLVELNLVTGAKIGEADIAPCDQIVFDPATNRVYTSGSGFISVVQATADGLKLLENVPVSKGAHTIMVDGRTHAVWISFADGGKSYFQSFSPIMNSDNPDAK
jgi:DNA-binding beta-propeller fold protein YncE